MDSGAVSAAADEERWSLHDILDCLMELKDSPWHRTAAAAARTVLEQDSAEVARQWLAERRHERPPEPIRCPDPQPHGDHLFTAIEDGDPLELRRTLWCSGVTA